VELSGCSLLYRDRELTLLPGREYTLGRSDADVLLPHGLVSRHHARLVWDDGRFWLIDQGSTNGTFVNGHRVTRHPLANGDRIKIGCFDLEFRADAGSSTGEDEITLIPSDTILIEQRLSRFVNELEDTAVARRFYELKELYDRKAGRLHDYAYKDPLTGLYNRRWFEERMDAEFARCVRYGRELHLALMDLDHFKRVNDTHGHRKGDEVLQAASAVLLTHSRASDVPARYGGEELLLLLPETDAAQAYAVAEKIRVAIHEASAQQAGVAVTVSIGIAGVSVANDSVMRLIEAADRMLYAAKAQGRDRTVIDVAPV